MCAIGRNTSRNDKIPPPPPKKKKKENHLYDTQGLFSRIQNVRFRFARSIQFVERKL